MNGLLKKRQDIFISVLMTVKIQLVLVKRFTQGHGAAGKPRFPMHAPVLLEMVWSAINVT